MSDSSKLMQWLEQHLKEQYADIALMRLIMQKFLVQAIPSIGAKEHLQDLEPIREVWIHDEGFTASRLSMMRIIARRTKATTVGA